MASQQSSKPSNLMLETCITRENCEDTQAAIKQLAESKEFFFLIKAYRTAKPGTQEYILGAIYISGYGRNDERLVQLMTTVAFDSARLPRFSASRWYALEFLAEKCDPRALEELIAGGATKKATYKYQVGCTDWAKTLELFGQCHSYTAKQVLLDSIDTSCLDVGNSALHSIEELYPKSCTTAHNYREALQCTNKYEADRSGLK
jgi:hypothetical protein